MEIKFKYRPEIKSIEDLQPGDEFLVGDERWKVDNYGGRRYLFGVQESCRVVDQKTNLCSDAEMIVAASLIRANVPIERDIPYPEGGAEKWELREGDYKTDRPDGTLAWRVRGENMHSWGKSITSKLLGDILYAIPKAKPQDKAKPAPKEYEVKLVSGFGQKWLNMGTEPCDSDGRPLKPGDRVTVQRVSEQGEPR
jgi:hypothetical protein